MCDEKIHPREFEDFVEYAKYGFVDSTYVSSKEVTTKKPAERFPVKEFSKSSMTLSKKPIVTCRINRKLVFSFGTLVFISFGLIGNYLLASSLNFDFRNILMDWSLQRCDHGDPEKCPYILQNSLLCSKRENMVFVVYVHSHRLNIKQRQHIRQTWGHPGLFAKPHGIVIFIVKKPLHQEDLKPLVNENKRFNDLVIVNIKSASASTTEVDRSIMRWHIKHCTGVFYLVRTVDNAMMNIFQFFIFLLDSVKLSEKAVLCSVEKTQSKAERCAPHIWVMNIKTARTVLSAKRKNTPIKHIHVKQFGLCNPCGIDAFMEKPQSSWIDIPTMWTWNYMWYIILKSLPKRVRRMSDDYMQFARNLTNVREPPHELPYILEEKNLCARKELLYLVYVSSSPERINQRSNIRKTFQSGSLYAHKLVRLFFVVGKPLDSKLQASLVKESQQFKDIVQGDFLDSKENRVVKSLVALRWIISFCEQAQFVIKIDDNVLLNEAEILKILRPQVGVPQRVIMCYVQKNVEVPRTNKTTIPVSMDQFPLYVFPDYCRGSAWIMAGKIVPDMLRSSAYLPLLDIEDAYVTGILAKAAGNVVFKHIPLFENDHVSKLVRYTDAKSKLPIASIPESKDYIRAWCLTVKRLTIIDRLLLHYDFSKFSHLC